MRIELRGSWEGKVNSRWTNKGTHPVEGDIWGGFSRIFRIWDMFRLGAKEGGVIQAEGTVKTNEHVAQTKGNKEKWAFHAGDIKDQFQGPQMPN